MATRLADDHAWVNILSRATVLLAIATNLVGVVTLIFGTLLWALYPTYRWLREGVWHSHSLADMLASESASDAWLLDMPLMIVLPSIGGALAVVGMAMFFSVSLVRNGSAGRTKLPRADH